MFRIRSLAKRFGVLVLSSALLVGQVLPLIGIASFAVTQTACFGDKIKKEDLAKWLGEVVATADDVRPMFISSGLSVARLDQLRDFAAKAKSALESSSGVVNDSALGYISSAITAFNTIINEVNIIKSQQTKTLILVGLFVAKTALRRISEKLSEAADSSDAPADVRRMGTTPHANTFRAFKEQPNWRCRSSQTGRFAKMEFCKAHPDVSVVETY